MPDSHKSGVITQEMYDNYHNVLYPNIMKNVNEYILPRAKEQGFLHLGLGFRLHTDDPDKQVRTLNNALNQFWSILTLLTINKLHNLIDKAGLEGKIKVTATIYDSIYFQVVDDPNVIKWLNDNLIPIMEQDFIKDQLVSNEAELEIGSSWADLHKLPHNADVDTITNTLKDIQC
jgi:hypothetical protein